MPQGAQGRSHRAPQAAHACSWASTSRCSSRTRRRSATRSRRCCTSRRSSRRRASSSEIEAYAPLVPDGSNWKATMLIEYPDANERKRELARLIGVEDRDVRRGRGPRRASTRSPTRTSTARTTRRPRRCTSCASSSRRRRATRCAPAPASSSAATTRNYPAHIDDRAGNPGQPGRRPALSPIVDVQSYSIRSSNSIA